MQECFVRFVMKPPLTREARLHAIVDVDVARRGGWAPIDLAAAFLRGGVRVLQVRAKSLSSSAFLHLSSSIHELARAAGAVVVVNDRADLAKIAGAEGVHLGQDDLTPAAARIIMGSAAILGLSTHTDRQIEMGVGEPVTYVAIGPVFETSTKTTGYHAVGLEGVRRAADIARPRGLGVIAIGGMTLGRAAQALEAGATGVAVITGLLEGGDPEARARAYVARLDEAAKV